jgi:ribose transport system substrate-binding protein
VTHRSRLIFGIFGASAAALTVLAVSACSSSSSAGGSGGTASSGAPSSAATSPGAAGSGASYAAAQVAKYRSVPTYTPPGQPIDISKLKGKTIYSIPIDTTTPFYVAIEGAQKKVAEMAGLHYVEFPADGSMTSFQQGIQQAINAKAGAILLDGPLPGTLAPQVAAARKAGIPVIPLHETDVTQPEQANVSAEAFAQFDQSARLFTDAAIADLNGTAVHALVIQAAETGPAKGMVAAIQDELANHAPVGSTTTVINVAVPQWSTQIQSQVQSALLRDPTINAVLPIYDSMAQYAAPGIAQAAGSRKIGIYSFNGTPAILQMLASNNKVKVDIAEDPNWVAYVAMDVTFRAMLGLPAPAQHETGPIRLIDSTNVAETGNPPQLGKGFGSAYEPGFAKLWGLG